MHGFNRQIIFSNQKKCPLASLGIPNNAILSHVALIFRKILLKPTNIIMEHIFHQ